MDALAFLDTVSKAKRLPVYALPRTFVQRVLYNADYLHFELCVRSAAESGVPSNRFVDITEEVLREFAVHDNHRRLITFIANIEISSRKDRYTHGLKISRRERVHVGLNIFAIFVLMSLN